MQLKYRGINPVFAFIEQPQTWCGRTHHSDPRGSGYLGQGVPETSEVRAAVGFFVNTYTREWLMGKNGFHSPWHLMAKTKTRFVNNRHRLTIPIIGMTTTKQIMVLSV